MRPAEDKKQQTRRQPLHTAAVGRIVLEFIPSEQHRGIGGKRQLRIAAAARPFFQRMQRAPTDLEMRARIRSRHAEQGKKSKIITQSHTRQRTVPFSKALAQRTIHALINLKITEGHLRLIGAHIAKHVISPLFRIPCGLTISILPYTQDQYMKDL